MTRVTGIALAAGSGTRMGTPKADLVVAGTRLLDRAITVLREAGCDPVLAVVRPGTDVTGATAVVNDDPDRGMRSSLQCGIEAAGRTPDAIAVVLVDTPGITPQATRAVIEAWRPGRIAVASYAGRRGHPTVMSPELWRQALERAEPDEGAKALLTAKAELIDEVAVEGDPTDLDTEADLARWNKRREPDAPIR